MLGIEKSSSTREGQQPKTVIQLWASNPSREIVAVREMHVQSVITKLELSVRLVRGRVLSIGV